MTGISTSIQLVDQMTAPLMNIINAVNLTVSAFSDMQSASAGSVDSSTLDGLREQADAATMALQELQENMKVTPPTPPVPVQPQWQSPQTIDVFSGSGMARFEQEAASANQMLTQLHRNQQIISSFSRQTDIFPAEMLGDLQNMDARIQGIGNQIRQLEMNPLDDIGADQVNQQIEQLRERLNQALQAQTDLTGAMQDMDVTRANEAYNRLNGVVDSTDRHIRDNMQAQEQFNNSIAHGSSAADGLRSKILSVGGAYLSMRGVSTGLGLADTMANTTARLNNMNDGFQTTVDLQNMIYLSAQRSGGAYQDTAAMVAKLGNQAKNAFSSNEELIMFAEQLNKTFAIAGTDATGVQSTMYNLTQALASGVLRGQDLNAVMSNAQPILQNIADYLDEDVSKIREMAANGQLTADVVKNAMLAAADETNAAFEKMPRTFSQSANLIKNNAMMAFAPIFNRLTELSNSEVMDGFINNVTNALIITAELVNQIFNLVGSTAGFINDNWSILQPLIMGVVAALGLYTAALLINKGVQIASAVITGILSAAIAIHTAFTSGWTLATFAQTVAQQGLNAALLACPITWIVIAVIALIAIIISVIRATQAWGIETASIIGMICGGVNVVIQFFKNLGLEVANVALGIWGAMGAIANNIQEAFKVAIGNVQGFFYNLASVALDVIGKIADSLSKLPFVEFDASGLVGKADEFAAKAAEASGYTAQYEDVSAAFNSGYGTHDTFQDGWVKNSYSAGYEIGEGLENKIRAFDPSKLLPSMDDYTSDIGDFTSVPDNIADIAGNTGSMKDAMEITGEDLKYMRDLADQEVVNRFTTAELNIKFTSNNNIKSDMDLDGVVRHLEDRVQEAMEAAAEGEHA